MEDFGIFLTVRQRISVLFAKKMNTTVHFMTRTCGIIRAKDGLFLYGFAECTGNLKHICMSENRRVVSRRKKCPKPIDNCVKRDIIKSSFFASVLPRSAVGFSVGGRTDKDCFFSQTAVFGGRYTSCLKINKCARQAVPNRNRYGLL